MRLAAEAGQGEARPAPDAVIATFVDLLGRLAAPAPAAAPAPRPPRARPAPRKA
jgi:hypothetical protein